MESNSASKKDNIPSSDIKDGERRSKSAGPTIGNNRSDSSPKKGSKKDEKKELMIRHAIPFKRKDKLICFFCRGKKCKHENYLNNKNSVIKGLDSDWILDNVLAMQRPSSRLIKEFGIIDQFKKHNIQAIFNLQELGEHPLCGDGIIPKTGFSYSSEEFSDHGICFFNFGWKDMTATDPETMLRIMDLMDFCLKDGQKISVHCHAGRGRTLLVIASWMIFRLKMSAKDAIALSKAKRKGVLSKKSQIKFLEKFETYLNDKRRIYHDSPLYNVDEVIKLQKKLASSELREKMKYCPLVLVEVCQRVENLITQKHSTPLEAITSFFSVDSEVFKNKWDSHEETVLQDYKKKLNMMEYGDLNQITDVRIFTQLLVDFLEGLASPAISLSTVEKLHTLVAKNDTELELFVASMSKVDFQIIKQFALILNIIRANDNDLEKFESLFGTRISIALLLAKKKFEKNFNKRSLMNLDNINDEHVKTLSKAIILISKNNPEAINREYEKKYFFISPKKINLTGEVTEILNNTTEQSEAEAPKANQDANKL